MAELIKLPGWQASPADVAGETQLLRCFGAHRRSLEDVYWLKENAELLGILDSAALRPHPGDLEPYGDFYAGVWDRFTFFPQYYRFLLSICLDLESLGMEGRMGERLAARILADDLIEGELSDLQRLEMRRLLGRIGLDGALRADWVEERVRNFMRRSEAFAIPNRTAVYNLTHAVFYLSDYGRRDPALDDGARTALRYAGTLALLEKNFDLLAEICIAMRWSGETPPEFWESWVQGQARRIRIACGPSQALPDDYHPYLVANWNLAVAGQPAFALPPGEGRFAFRAEEPDRLPLRDLSHLLLRIESPARRDWHHVRRAAETQLSEEVVRFIGGVEQSSPWFEAFFVSFARAGQPAPRFADARA